MRINKKASLETKEIIELILAGVGIFILIFLVWSLIAPDFNEDRETAKAYKESFEEIIGEVEEALIVIGPPSAIVKTEVELSLILIIWPVEFCWTVKAAAVVVAKICVEVAVKTSATLTVLEKA